MDKVIIISIIIIIIILRCRTNPSACTLGLFFFSLAQASGIAASAK
jgi:hypothetical protein